jgi:hypothetical protein
MIKEDLIVHFYIDRLLRRLSCQQVKQFSLSNHWTEDGEGQKNDLKFEASIGDKK